MIAKIRKKIDALKKQTQTYCNALSPLQRKRLLLIGFAAYALLTLSILWHAYQEYHQGDAPALQHINNQAIVPTKGNTLTKDSLTLKTFNNGKEHTSPRAKH